MTETVLGVVAIDDAFGIVLLGLHLAVAQLVAGDRFSAAVLTHGLWEVPGGLLVDSWSAASLVW